MFNPCAAMRLVSCKRPRERIPTLPESLVDIADKFFPFVQFLGFHKTRKVFPRFCELIESRGFLKVKDRRHVHARPHKGGFCTFPCLLAPGSRPRSGSSRNYLLASPADSRLPSLSLNFQRNDQPDEKEVGRHF